MSYVIEQQRLKGVNLPRSGLLEQIAEDRPVSPLRGKTGGLACRLPKEIDGHITMKYVDFEREYFFSHLIWLFPIAVLFHVIEESNGFAYWVTNVLQGEMHIRAFYRNIVMGIIVTISLCLIAFSTRTAGTTFLLFLWVSTIQFWNFVFHMYAQYRFQIYSPGYFTAVLLYLPLYSYLSYLSLRERFLPWYLWLFAFVAGCFLMGFIIWAGLYHLGPIPWEKWFF